MGIEIFSKYLIFQCAVWLFLSCSFFEGVCTGQDSANTKAEKLVALHEMMNQLSKNNIGLVTVVWESSGELVLTSNSLVATDSKFSVTNSAVNYEGVLTESATFFNPLYYAQITREDGGEWSVLKLITDPKQVRRMKDQHASFFSQSIFNHIILPHSLDGTDYDIVKTEMDRNDEESGKVMVVKLVKKNKNRVR